MIIGGGEIYRAALAYADTIYMSEIAADPDGDTWFPALDPAEWAEKERIAIAPDPRDDHAAVLIVYQRTAPGGTIDRLSLELMRLRYQFRGAGLRPLSLYRISGQGQRRCRALEQSGPIIAG